MEDFEKEIVKERLLDGVSISAIAKEVGKPSVEVRATIKALGLDWLVSKNRKLSKGHAALLALFEELLPNYEIVTEHYVGARLHLDVYCAGLNIGAEFHGRQHFEYVPHFHSTKADFLRGQENDQLKIEKCQELGIALVVFCYNEDLSLEAVTSRILEAVVNSKPAEKVEKYSSLSSKSDYYQKMKLLRNEQRREQYKKMKQGKQRD